jgi:putative transposase
VLQEPRKRLKRVESQQHARFLTFSCFRNQAFLGSDRTRGWLAEAIDSAADRYDFELWAYVFMPTHAHLLIRSRSPVPSILRSVKQSVSRRATRWASQESPKLLGRMRDTGGVHRFWQRGGGYDRNLWTPAHIWDAIEYIHRNPVEAGLCDDPHAWAWSSALRFRDVDAEGAPRLSLNALPARPM